MRQRELPFVQPQVPLPRQTGVSPVQAGWFTQLPPTQRCGVLDTQRVESSKHPQRPVWSRQTGVAPEQAASSCQAPVGVQI